MGKWHALTVNVTSGVEHRWGAMMKATRVAVTAVTLAGMAWAAVATAAMGRADAMQAG